ncbi:MAG TPA: hypothetical protein VLA34_10590, partial [Candidatus Krumholzibacterium sp.]|nr:hypothetical protein [Candidatus Krumholzibacterium sp.]
MKRLDLSVNEIDGLLEQLYKRLKGKKEGLSLIEPSVILLQALKDSDSPAYPLYLKRFSPVIIDALLARADRAFGFDGLQALLETTRDLSVISEDYTPDGLREGIESVKAKIGMIQAVLRGNSIPPEASERLQRGQGIPAGRLFPENAFASVSLPLVSIYKTGAKPLALGRVLEPRVELRVIGEWSMHRAEKPVITFTNMAAEPNGDFEKQIFLAVRLAERFAAKRMNLRDISRIPREYRFSIPETAFLPASILGMMKGGSAGLALATMVITAIGRLGLSSRTCECSLSTAYTGMLDEDGRVLPVDDEHIKNKVYATFFSTCDTLVAPEENIKTAETELSRLREEFPERRLKIVSATDLSSTCEDPAISATGRIPVAKVFLRRMFHWRKHLLVAIMGVASLVLFLMLYTRYLDAVAISADLVGQDIVFTNRHGAVVKKHHLGFETESKSPAESHMYIGNFDNDRSKDFFYVYLENRKNYQKTGKRNQAHLLYFNHKGKLERHLV